MASHTELRRRARPEPSGGAPTGDGPSKSDTIREQQRQTDYAGGAALVAPGTDASGLEPGQAQSVEPSKKPEALKWWEYPSKENPNLRGSPPVRSRDEPPNKEVVEDEGVMSVKRKAANDALDEQRSRAQGFLDRDGFVQDNRYWFAKVYSYTTEGELLYVANNAFYYPSYALECVLLFDQLYEDNIQLADSGGTTEDHWAKAFRVAASQLKQSDLKEEAQGPSGMAVLAAAAIPMMIAATKSLVASMLAHIRFDLPRAEVWAYEATAAGNPKITLNDFRPDFFSMAGIFDRSALEMMNEISARTGVPANLAPTELQDWGLQNLFGPDMDEERALTWQRTEALHAGGKNPKNPYPAGEQLSQLESDDAPERIGDQTTMGGLDALSGGARPDMDAPTHDDEQDDQARKRIRGPNLEKLSVAEKIVLLRRLAVDNTGDEDENAALKLLYSAERTGQLFEVLDGSDIFELRGQFQGAEQTKFERLLRTSMYFARTSAPNAAYFIIRCARESTDELQEKWISSILLMRAGEWQIFRVIGDGEEAPGVRRISEELEGEAWTAIARTWRFAEHFKGLPEWVWNDNV